MPGQGIPVIFGTLVSNDRNMPPFHAQEEPAGVEAATVREHLRKVKFFSMPAGGR